MKKFLENVFGPRKATSGGRTDTQHNIHVATAALLVEVAGSDDNFAPEEKDAIIRNLESYFNLSDDEVEEIIEAGKEQLERRLDLYYFAQQINRHFDREQKIAVIEMVWRVIYSDDHLSGHEDHLAHRFARLLRLDHSELIAAKLRVKKEREEGG
jgi:uncharacterized tellurite resistance protein B-like protein